MRDAGLVPSAKVMLATAVFALLVLVGLLAAACGPSPASPPAGPRPTATSGPTSRQTAVAATVAVQPKPTVVPTAQPKPTAAPTPTTAERFSQALAGDASCQELFELRNARRRQLFATGYPNDGPEIRSMNDRLDLVNCHTSSSDRAPETPPRGSAGTAYPFTVAEYRIYKEVIETPMAIADAPLHFAQTHARPVAEIRAIVNNVMLALTTLSAFGSRAVEIRQATDWDGETE